MDFDSARSRPYTNVGMRDGGLGTPQPGEAGTEPDGGQRPGTTLQAVLPGSQKWGSHRWCHCTEAEPGDRDTQQTAGLNADEIYPQETDAQLPERSSRKSGR